MKIINDTEVFEPRECYFTLSTSEDFDSGVIVSITSIDFWKENQCLDDCFGTQSLDQDVNQALLDAGISQEMEAMWGTDLTEDAAREVLTKLGFVESKEMGEILDRTANGE